MIAQHIVTTGGRAIQVLPDGKAYPSNKTKGDYYYRDERGVWYVENTEHPPTVCPAYLIARLENAYQVHRRLETA